MRFDVITIFPKIIEAYLGESILKRAQERKLVEFCIYDLHKFSRDAKHHKVDDRPYGGGPGMVMQAEPIAQAIGSALKAKGKPQKAKIVLFSARGKQFTAKMAADWAKRYDRIIMIAGRYEGVDERIKKIYRMEEISMGPYVLTGGELPALVVADAVSRHIPGVLGAHESLEEKRYGVGVPAYTRPEIFRWPARGRDKKKKTYRVPKVLLSGDHKKIAEWRKKHAK